VIAGIPGTDHTGIFIKILGPTALPFSILTTDTPNSRLFLSEEYIIWQHVNGNHPTNLMIGTIQKSAGISDMK
jgi:hypothetical protein